MLYYFPMEIIGIYKWKKHLKKEVREVIKTRLTNKERIIYFSVALILSLVVSLILKVMGDSKPFLDGTATVLSVIGQFLTVKRCIEQWYVWFVVNVLTCAMWTIAYLDGSNCFATILMWFFYTYFAIYFLQKWKKEITSNEDSI